MPRAHALVRGHARDVLAVEADRGRPPAGARPRSCAAASSCRRRSRRRARPSRPRATASETPRTACSRPCRASSRSTASRLMRAPSRGRRRSTAASRITACGSPSAITRPASMQTSRVDHLDEHVDDVLDPDDRDAALRAARGSSRRARRPRRRSGPPPISSSSSTTGVGRERARQLEPLAVEQAEALGAAVGERRVRPQCSSTSMQRVVGRAARAARRRSRAPTKTFSNTVMPPNGRGTWCARPMPEPAAACRRRPGDVVAAEADRARRRRERAGEHVEQRRLARRRWGRRCRPPRRRRREVDAVEDDERAEALADPGRRRGSACRSGRPRARVYALYGLQLRRDRHVRVGGVLADHELELELARSALTHWPPMIGVGHDVRRPGPCPTSRCPTGVSTVERLRSRSATAALSFGFAARLERRRRRRRTARGSAPSCWFHCLPRRASCSRRRAALRRHAGQRRRVRARSAPSRRRSRGCSRASRAPRPARGTGPVLAIWAILICFV